MDDIATIESNCVGIMVSLLLDRRTGRVSDVVENSGSASPEQLQAIRHAVVGLPVGPAYRFIQRLGNTLVRC